MNRAYFASTEIFQIKINFGHITLGHLSFQAILTIYIPVINIQGDSGGICITLGNDSMSDSKQKSSYEHGSDFERLRSYGHFLIPLHALM